jgi:hypothetical protein
VHSTGRTQRDVGLDWQRLSCHDHQGSLLDPPLCVGPVNVQTPGLLKRHRIFCSLRIYTRPRFPGCSIRKFKVNVERIEVWDKQRKSTRFKIKGRGRNASVGLMNIRGVRNVKKAKIVLVLELEWLHGFSHLLVAISSWVSRRNCCYEERRGPPYVRD